MRREIDRVKEEWEVEVEEGHKRRQSRMACHRKHLVLLSFISFMIDLR